MKSSSFIVADPVVCEDLGIPIIVMLNAVAYNWADNYEALIEWCGNNNCTVEGMTVNIPDQHTLTLFTLRWA